MANKYAVASGLWSDAATWSDSDGGAGGASVPADDDAVFILLNVAVQMDVDLSAYTGLRAVTIRGHATTPAMLYWKDSAGPGLRIGTTNTNVRTDRFSIVIAGTYYAVAAVAAGTALAGSDVPDGKYGAWAFDIGTDSAIHCTEATNNATGQDTPALAVADLPAVAASHVRVGYVTAMNTGAVFDPGATALDAAGVTEAYTSIAAAVCNYGYLKIRTTYNLVGTTGTLKGRLLANSNGTWGATGSLAFADKAVIDLGATSKIDAQYLDIALYCTNNMAHKYLTTYGVLHTVTADAGADTLTKNSHGLANTTPVMIMSSGAIPAPLAADVVYYVVNTATNTFKLSGTSGGTAINLTDAGSDTIKVYTGAASGADPVSVFEDVSAETGWTNATGHNRVVVCNGGPGNTDQQRLTITTLDTDHIHLSAALDSLQYPGARIGLASRNVSIRWAGTSGIIIDYSSAGTAGGVFQCEVVATAGTGTTFYGYAFQAGVGVVVSGTVTGAANVVLYGVGYAISATVMAVSLCLFIGVAHEMSGLVMGCSAVSEYGGNNILSGTFFGCTTVITSGFGITISGTATRCGTAVNAGTGHRVSGAIIGCSLAIGSTQGCVITGGIGYTAAGVYAPNTTDFAFPAVNAITGITCVVRGGWVRDGSIKTAPTLSGRNVAGIGSQARLGVFCEDYGPTLAASYTYLPTGDVIKNTTTVRSGGAASSLEVVPLSNCSVYAPILVCEWTELSVPASAQNKSVYVKGEGWTFGGSPNAPTAAELYFEAEYISNATTFARTTVASTEVLTDNTTWVQLATGSFTPAAAGHVRYRVWLKKYAASTKVYLDNALYSA